MRKLHRLIGIVSAIFLLCVATSGVLLQIEELSENEDKELNARVVDASKPANVEAGTERHSEAEEHEDSLLLQIHTGKFFGSPGVYVSILCGCTLILLTLSGSYLYYQIFRARAKRHLSTRT